MPDEPGESPRVESFETGLSDEEWLSSLRRAETRIDLGRLGDYVLLSELGRGAQGVVYKAVQPHTKRIVALKRLAAGSLATPAMQERFEREIEAACLLNHPGIVTVHGVEVLEGQPVLTMEWVDGVPIDAWAYGPPARAVPAVLAVFVQACEAVAHAHRRGVLHRDLKPSNILVDRHDRARVLDFGLAKVLPEFQTWAGAALTRTTAFLGTPAYGPPEALDLPDAFDTRGDVYALGIILYRLLAGVLPFDVSRGVASLFDQIRRGVTRPPSAHRADLGTELDAIVLKASAPEPERRYGSAEELAADVRRFLAGEAVLAHPPGRVYLARKFVRRHRAAVSILAGAFLVTAALAATATAFAVRLGRQSQRLALALQDATSAREQEAQARAAAESSAQEARTALGRAGRQTLRYQAATQVLEGLMSGKIGLAPEDAAARQPPAALEARDPAQAARLRRELARMFVDVGLFREALEQAEECLRLVRATEGPASRPAIQALVARGQCLAMLGRLADAEADMREVLRLREGIGREGGPALASAHADLALLMIMQGRLEEAESLYRTALDMRPESGRRPLLARYEMERDLGFALLEQGRFAESEAQTRRALELVKDHDRSDETVRRARRNLALAWHGAGRLEEAEASLRVVIEEWVGLHGPEHPLVARESLRLAPVLADLGRLDEAQAIVRQALESLAASMPVEHPWLTAGRLELVDLAERGGDLEGAAVLAREALEKAAEAPPGCELHHAQAAARLALSLRRRGLVAEAEAALEDARRAIGRRVAPDHPLGPLCARVLDPAR